MRREYLKVPWRGKRCIICLKETKLCDEHLIPEALGGKLTCKFLCVHCNSRLGRMLESSAKSDPAILLSAKNLEKDIPQLTGKLIKNHPHIGHSEQGSTCGYIKNNEFRVKAKKLKDGSIIQPTDEARKTIAKIIGKSKFKNISAQQALSIFDHAPENKKVAILPGFEIVKWTVQKIELDLNKSQLMDLLMPAKIAFEFMVLHMGVDIYKNIPRLSELREIFLNPEHLHQAVQVERLSSNKYEPFHGLCFEGNDPYVKVQIRLFGWLAFRVHFLYLSVSGPRIVYTHELETGKEFIDVMK